MPFLTRWRAALVACSEPDSIANDELGFWEGKSVCEELRRAGLFDFIMLSKKAKQENWKRNELARLLLTEIKSYKKARGRVAQINRELAEAVDFFSRIEKRFSKERIQFAYFKEIRSLIANYARDFGKQKIRFVHMQKWFWRSPTGLEAILREPRYKWAPDRDVDLDGGFQKRIARSLRAFLPRESGVSLLTISRLVVLVYLSAGLVEVRNGNAIIAHSGKNLFVTDVEAKLRRAAIDRRI